MKFSSRMSCIAPSPTLKVAAEADRLRRQGLDVVDLGAGEPDFATPEHICQAARAAIDAHFTKYTPSAGGMELREAVCTRYRDDYGVAFRPEEVIITAGAKQALYNAALGLFEEGDEVITHAPYWPTIPEQIKLAGATPVIVPTHPEDGFTIHAGPILERITARTKGIVINSPCNPTGALISDEAVTAIADAAVARGLWIVADVTYEKLLYDGAAHNVVRILVDRAKDRTVICGATSKAYAMTGWRCGWAIAPAKAIATFNALQGHATSNVASISQKAAFAALTGPQESVAHMLHEYQGRRDLVWEWLTEDRRFTCLKPRGAFYLLPHAVDALEPAGLRTTAEFAEKLLEESLVAVTAGEGVRCARIFPHLLRHFDRPAPRRRHAHSRVREEARDARRRRAGAGVPAQPEAKAVRHDTIPANPRLCRLVYLPRSSIASCRLTAVVGAEYARTDVESRDKYGHDALQIGHPADLVLLPADVGRNRRHRPGVRRTAHANGGSRRGHGLYRRRRAGPRRRGHFDGTAQSHSRDRRREFAGRRAAQRHHPRPAGRRGSARAVLSAGSGQPEAVVARRQRRRMRGRTACRQVRHDQAIRARARGGPADRRNHSHRIEGGEERRRLRPDATARRIRGDAGDRHGDHAAPGAEAGRAGDAAGDICRHQGGRGRGHRPPRRPRRAGDNRIDRPRVADRRRAAPVAHARAARHRRDADHRGGRRARRRGRGVRARDCGVHMRPARSRSVGRRARPSARPSGKRAASCRSRCEPSRRARSITTSWCRAAACRNCSTWSNASAASISC